MVTTALDPSGLSAAHDGKGNRALSRAIALRALFFCFSLMPTLLIHAWLSSMIAAMKFRILATERFLLTFRNANDSVLIARLFGPGRRRNAASLAQVPPPGGGTPANAGLPDMHRHQLPHSHWRATHPSQHRLQLPHWSSLEPIPEQSQQASSDDKFPMWRPAEIIEAVCVKHPDGYVCLT